MIGCAPPNPPAPASLPKTEPNTSASRAGDPEMDAAIAKARASLDSFIERLAHPANGEVFSVEAGVPAADGSTEYRWMDDVTYKDGVFEGRFRTRPSKNTTFKPAEKATVKKEDVTDWIILREGKSEGGYTVELQLRRQSEPR
jgi:uncharacterized protein YegJ (DUF2314 family)